MPVLDETGGAPRGTVAADARGISFRSLRSSDLGSMHRWLNAPHVARWWYGEGTSRQQIEAKYLPRIENRGPVKPFIILHAGEPIGYVQSYPTGHDARYAELVGIEDSVGTDLFIGEEDHVYRGLGGPLLRRFMGEHVFSEPGVEVCVIGPEPENAAAIRACEKAGFRHLKTIQVPGLPESEYLMKISKKEFEGNDAG